MKEQETYNCLSSDASAKPLQEGAHKVKHTCRFEEAVKQYTVDLTERMVKIKNTLDNKEESPESVNEKEALLDELIEIVDNIDYARGARLLTHAL